jgi:hypothetical protein
LSFARNRGIEIFFGNPEDEIPGKNIILPSSIDKIKVQEIDLQKMKESYIVNAVKNHPLIQQVDLLYLAKEVNESVKWVKEKCLNLHIQWEEKNEREKSTK